MKLRLSGGVTYCCAGDALKEEQARAFPENYRKLISSFREAMGDPSLPFVSAITPLTNSCNKKGRNRYDQASAQHASSDQN